MLNRKILRAIALVLLLLTAAPWAAAAEPLNVDDFEFVADQGFGDRQNSMAWSMEWWNGKLFVGTVRSNACMQRAIQQVYFPWMTYPPLDENLECAPDPDDLPLRGEIWAYTPGTNTWERVFQAPEIPIPGSPGKFVGVDLGYRDMEIFVESDGTEALYVAGFSSTDFHDVPPPRILRSTDGVNFAPLPQLPGTFLGELDILNGLNVSGFNRLIAYNDMLFVTIGGAYGHGTLVAASEPELGNNAFQPVMATSDLVTEMEIFQDQLYVATGAQPIPGSPPYAILRTNAAGSPPFTFVPVLMEGGFRSSPSTTVAHMETYNGRLYAGTNRPTELVRVNPDDTWDLLVGDARATPQGYKRPLSGMNDGFDWYWNIHIHQMQEHDGWLYLATNDQGGQLPWINIPIIKDYAATAAGFDVYRTRDGVHFYPVTRKAFGEEDFTGRVWASTPEGLFLGTGNDHYGLHILRATDQSPDLVTPPADLQIEKKSGNEILSWDASPEAQFYRVFRSDTLSQLAFEQVGTTFQTYFSDQHIGLLTRQFYIVADDGSGNLSAPSNLVTGKSNIPPVSILQVKLRLNSLAAAQPLKDALQASRTALLSGDRVGAVQGLEALDALLVGSSLAPWQIEDLRLQVGQLARRVRLHDIGLLTVLDLLF